MANDISANPWKVNVPATVYSYPVKLKGVIWANQAVGNTLLIQDINGKDIINAIAVSGIATQVFPDIGWVRGLVLVTITSGEITISIGAGK